MSSVNPKNYICIQGWMVSDLGLKGNELIVYAIIYGFSQDGDNEFKGSLQYLADWTNSSKESMRKVLNSLVSKGLVEKNSAGELCNKVVYTTKFAMQQSCMPYTTKLDSLSNKVAQTMQQSCTPSRNINNLSNLEDTLERSSLSINDEFENIWKHYPRKVGKVDALRHYTKYRKMNPDASVYELVLNRVVEYEDFCQKQYRGETRYIPHGSTWFNQMRWLDEDMTKATRKQTLSDIDVGDMSDFMNFGEAID